MKSIILIFTFLFSFIVGGGKDGDVCNGNIYHTDAVVQCTDNDATDKNADLNNAALLPVRTVNFSGNGSNYAPSVHSTRSGRRVHPSTKSAYHVIKDGKVLDINNFYTTRTFIIHFRSGIRSNSRYIHSICQLLI